MRWHETEMQALHRTKRRMHIQRTRHQAGCWRQANSGASESHRRSFADKPHERILVIVTFASCEQHHERGLPSPKFRQYATDGNGPANQRHRHLDEPSFEHLHYAKNAQHGRLKSAGFAHDSRAGLSPIRCQNSSSTRDDQRADRLKHLQRPRLVQYGGLRSSLFRQSQCLLRVRQPLFMEYLLSNCTCSWIPGWA
jgi:hypothetical protein